MTGRYMMRRDQPVCRLGGDFMRYGIGWTALLATALGASACAYGVVDEGEDDDQVATSASYQSGTPTGAFGGTSTGTPTGTTSAPSGGVCYWGAGECNPMWSDCGTGETCDATDGEGFACFPPPNDAGLGGSCDAALGPYCRAGSTCVDGICRAFCCDHSDCGVGSCANTGMASDVVVKACLP